MQFPRKDLSTRTMNERNRLVSTFKSHNVKIRKLVVSGLRTGELAHYSEAMTATEGFHIIRRINITNNSRGLETDLDQNAGFSLPGNVITSK